MCASHPPVYASKTELLGFRIVSKNYAPAVWVLLTGVAVEKPLFLKKRSQTRDRKCLPKSRTAFIGHRSAMKLLQTSREGVFQQPRLFTTTTKVFRSG